MSDERRSEIKVRDDGFFVRHSEIGRESWSVGGVEGRLEVLSGEKKKSVCEVG